MAWYDITYECGHTTRKQLYGKMSDRDRTVEWYKTIKCPECEAKAQAEKAEADGLPQLTGSEKQIAWAIQIRNKAIEMFDAEIRHYISKHKNADMDLIDKTKESINKWIAKETTAKYWIDNRESITGLRYYGYGYDGSINDVAILIRKSLSTNTVS